jgi:DNA modification methylase
MRGKRKVIPTQGTSDHRHSATGGDRGESASGGSGIRDSENSSGQDHKSETLASRPIREVPAPEGAPRLVWVDPSTLTPNQMNWRIHTDEQRVLVGDSIDDPGIGWAGVCLYNQRTGKLLDGHLRRDHAFNSRLPVPVLVGNWSPEKEAAIMVLLDQSTGMARADTSKLLALFQKAAPPTERSLDILKRLTERQGVVFPDVPTDDGTDEGEDTGGSPGDEDAEARKRQELLDKWAVEPGSLWHCQSKDGLRIHRIMCGDSTSDKDVARLFDGRYADMVLTSPPYAQQRDYSGDMLPWDDLMRGVFTTIPAGPDTQILVNLGITYKESCLDFYWLEWLGWMKSRGWRPFAWYVWDQGWGLPGDYNGRLAPAHEWLFHFNKNAIDPNKCVVCKEAGNVYDWNGARRGPGDSFEKKPPAPIQERKIHDSVFRVSRAGGQGIAHLHPAIMAVGLAREVIECYSQANQNVYDPFGGAGSTLLACEASGRTGFAMEI